jgi:hypothetical protein
LHSSTSKENYYFLHVQKNMSTGVFREHVASVASISRYDSEGPESTGASYKTQLHKSQTVEYDFSVDGGLVSTINLELKYPIPSGSIVYASTAWATTTYASGGASTVSFGVDAANDLNAAPITVAQINAGWRESRESAVAPVITTAERTVLTITIGTAAATAGVISLNVEYIEPNDA